MSYPLSQTSGSQLEATIDGYNVKVGTKHHMNAATIVALVVMTGLFFVFTWFYISPIVRNKDAIKPITERTPDVEPRDIHPMMDQQEKHTLMAWMRRGSRGRFVDTEGNHGNTPRPKSSQGRRSFFARSSTIPHITPITPPPAYATRPSTPTQGYQPSPTAPSSPTPAPVVVSACAPIPTSIPSPRSQIKPHPLSQSHLGPSQPPTVSRIFVPERRISLRSTSAPSSPSPATMPRFDAQSAPVGMEMIIKPPIAKRSVSENTLHPSFTGLPVPSRALVYGRGALRDPNLVEARSGLPRQRAANLQRQRSVSVSVDRAVRGAPF